MKKLLFPLLIPCGIFAQIGINTTVPSATFDVTAKSPTGTNTTREGMLIPRIDK